MGDKIGRIHLGKQDLGDLQTRKMKGLKRGRDVDAGDTAEDDEISMASGNEVETSSIVDYKRARTE